jgi:PTH1 family peptidyl-tRNA hydrolase
VVFGRRGSAPERRGTPADLLVIGLGNPGIEYANSRHNLGADTVAYLADRHGGRLKMGKERALSCEVRIGPHLVALAFPQTFYNESGTAAAALARRHGITDPHRLVVVHDEMDLPPGTLKVKVGGGLAGNRGLKSIKAHLGTDDFVRIRVGIGKPPGRQQGTDHVLRRPGKAERATLDLAMVDAADAVEAVLTDGPEAAMNRYNGRA